MTLTVGYVSELHTEPCYFDMARRGLALVEMCPSALAAAAANGEIDAGPIPLVDCFRLADRFQPVSGFGVASVKQAGSVFLHARKPMEALSGARIGLRHAGSTEAWLVHMLLRLKYQIQRVTYVTLQEPSDAVLVVGNQGLRQRRGVRGFPHHYDLGAEWYAWTGLPCVLSRWLVRQDVASQEKALLEDTLYVGLEEGVNAMYQRADPRDDLLMLPREITAYIRGLRYFLRRPEQRAIAQFCHYLHQLDGSVSR